MSYVIADPEMMTSAAADLATIGSDLSAAHLAAAAPTVSLIPAAADEVSAAVTHLFSQHAAGYQALAGQAATFNDQFVQHLTAGAFSYASIEATIASLLRDLQDVPATIASLLQEQLIQLLSPLFSQLLSALILSDPLELWAIRSTFASSVAG
jgi:hypothetical protein